MGFSTWHTYGYGVKASVINCDSIERLKALLQLAPKLNQSIEQWLKESDIQVSSVEDYYEFDEDYRLGLATIMKEVIMEAENIEFTPCDDFDGDTYLLYGTTYPWNLTEKEKDLTEEKVKEILVKYFSIITDDPIEVDYFDPENGG